MLEASDGASEVDPHSPDRFATPYLNLHECEAARSISPMDFLGPTVLTPLCKTQLAAPWGSSRSPPTSDRGDSPRQAPACASTPPFPPFRFAGGGSFAAAAAPALDRRSIATAGSARKLSGTFARRASLPHAAAAGPTSPEKEKRASGWDSSASIATSEFSEVVEHVAFQRPGLELYCDQGGVLTRVNDYVVLQELATGATGTVYQVCDPRTDEMLAMKAVPRRSHQDCVDAEIECLRKLNHRNVTQLLQVIDCSDYQEVFMVLTLVEGGPLCSMNFDGTLAGRVWKEEPTRDVFRQMLEGLDYLHSAGVMHRDIKPDNVLLERGTGRLVFIDFGVGFCPGGEDDSTRRTVGTPFFLPPEATTEGFVAARALDLWAVAVIVHLLLVGRVPFGAGCQGGRLLLAARVAEDKLVFDVPISAEVQSLLRRMLDKDLACRPTIPEILDSPWITGCDLALPLERVPTRSGSEMWTRRSTMCSLEQSTRSDEITTPLTAALSPVTPTTCSLDSSVGPAAEQQTVLSSDSPRRVLLADPCFHSRRVTSRLLRELVDDVVVETCSSGQEAIERATSATSKYDVLLIDLHTPQVSGIEAVLRIRRWESAHCSGAPLSVFAVTTSDDSTGLAALFCEAGIAGLLRKPLDFRGLRVALTSAGMPVCDDFDVKKVFVPTHQYDVSYRRRASLHDGLGYTPLHFAPPRRGSLAPAPPPPPPPFSSSPSRRPRAMTTG
eukprot:TRINITY_DN4137_c3_g1_i2.p1 TRINITY_DN4137_c3_g1~~TRINITY_DN4137_c3_g1_i2.p1  ORF type:complete len:724 (+),score=166.71 TRINITY_DN4137_c3_g1_i2:398-2569(+)